MMLSNIDAIQRLASAPRVTESMRSESRRDSGSQPRVVATRLPWDIGPGTSPTATRLRPFRFLRSTGIRHDPVGVVSLYVTFTQGRRCAPTLGWTPVPRWGTQAPHQPDAACQPPEAGRNYSRRAVVAPSELA